jgi:rhodanese-related sulfurtransferase
MGMTGPGGRWMGIERVLAAARARLVRVSPAEAAQLVADGGLLVDTRPVEQRRREGEVPGALVIDRNVLEWRLDPASDHRIPEITGYDQVIVVMCSEGYSSSLAAAALQDVGLVRATDLEGGFRAWAASGLPVRGAAR